LCAAGAPTFVHELTTTLLSLVEEQEAARVAMEGAFPSDGYFTDE
jgi:hypothetical protein